MTCCSQPELLGVSLLRSRFDQMASVAAHSLVVPSRAVGAKQGLVRLMKVLALELGPGNIRVNTMHLTTVFSPVTQNHATLELFLPGRPPEQQTREVYAGVSQSPQRHAHPLAPTRRR